MFASLGGGRAPPEIGMPPPRINFSEFRYEKDEQIFGENEPADYVYQVTFGAVRSYKLLVDGRRQIGAFHLAGDIFGLENAAVHRLTAEAIVDTKVRLVKRQTLELIAEKDVLVARDLLNTTATKLEHAEDHMLLLGRKTALERVATFLLEMDILTRAWVFCAFHEPTRYRGLSGAYLRDGFPRASPTRRKRNSGIPEL